MKPVFYKLLSWMAVTLFVLFGSFFIFLAYTYLYPHKTLEVKNSPMPIINGSVFRNGDVLTYRYDYCKYYDSPIHIQKEFVDGIIFRTEPTYVSQLEYGCHQKDVSIMVPESLPEGEYKVRITTQIVLNQLRTVTVVYETQKFSVVK